MMPQCEDCEEQNIVWKEEETTVSAVSVCESKENIEIFNQRLIKESSNLLIVEERQQYLKFKIQMRYYFE